MTWFRRMLDWVFPAFFLLGLLAIVFGLVFRPITNGIHKARQSAHMQASHAIGLALYSYANDHAGNYPTGKNSTEVFQILLDGGYLTDPATVYFPMPGKIAPVADQKLKPENVCWDFTVGTTTHSPVVLPLVFTTGYRVTYTPGSAAVAVITPFPRYLVPARTWKQWWHGEQARKEVPGIAAFYISNSAKYSVLTDTTADRGSVPNFISPDFVPVGETYRQLTPDGTLPP